MRWTSRVAVCAVALLVFSTAMAQESPDEAKRRAALEAEKRAAQERDKDEARAREVEETKRKAEAERRAAESGKDAPQAEFRVTLAGTVSNEQGLRIGGAEVQVTYDSSLAGGHLRMVPRPETVVVGRVAADGTFRVEFGIKAVKGLNSLRLGVSIDHADYLPGPQLEFDAAADSVHDALAVTLRKGAEISGRVTDEGGAPLADTLVSAVRDTSVERASGTRKPLEQTREVRTDKQGIYAIRGLHAGQFVVSTQRVGWGSADYTPTLELKERAVKTGFDFKLPKVTALFAKVELSDNASGPVKVTVRFTSGENHGHVANGVIDNGRLAVETANTGTWTIEILADGYRPSAPMEVEIAENQHLELGEITLIRMTKEDYPELPND